MLQSVPVYLCLQNSLGGLLYLVEVAPGFRGGAGPLLASLTVVVSAAATVLADIDMTVYLLMTYGWKYYPSCNIPTVL